MALDYLDKLGTTKQQFTNLPLSPVGIVLKKFTEAAILKMKASLEKSGRKATGALGSSIAPKFVPADKAFDVEITMMDYWDYVNSGVDGVLQSAGATTNAFGTTYQFKTLNPSKGMVESFTGAGSLRGWMATQGITSMFGEPLESESDFESAAFVLARGTKKHGIAPSHFADEAFSEKEMQFLQDKIFEAVESMY